MTNCVQPKIIVVRKHILYSTFDTPTIVSCMLGNFYDV